ncbi:MAG TPA: CaiB/BaiF CoA-transferase family protein [Solirubrobacteraceae bacterium]
MGPLAGVKIVELGSIGPGPFAAMVLADLGADIIRVDRPGQGRLLDTDAEDPVLRGRPTVEADLKSDAGRALVLELVARADALIEGFRPGVIERLGLGPDVLLEHNPRLVIGRMTGYGQEGPLAQVPGHDVNYISVSGALGLMAREGERPLFPLNLVGDYGGGGMLLALGVVCAVLEARGSGEGQVVDAAMVDGSALLTTVFHGLRAGGAWRDTPGTNVLDSGAHFYEVYETADGGHVSVGAIEPQFYADLLRLLEVDAADAPQWDKRRWPELKTRFAEIFKTRTRDEWAALLEHADACATPVLTLDEAVAHPHNVARGTFVQRDGLTQPAAAPRFSRTPGDACREVPSADEALEAWGVVAYVSDS